MPEFSETALPTSIEESIKRHKEGKTYDKDDVMKKEEKGWNNVRKRGKGKGKEKKEKE